MNLSKIIFETALLGAFVSVVYAQVELPEGTLTLDEVLKVLQPENSQTKLLSRAKIRVLEFSSNNLTDIDLTANTPAKYKELTILLKACQPNQADAKGSDVAWLEISEPVKNKYQPASKETPEENAEETNIDFAGWMFNNLTDISTLDHPKYDVRLLKCLEPIEIKTLQANPAEVDPPKTEELNY